MISIASPFVLGIAVFGALVTCVLHFLSVRRPPTLVLPTMRFLPDRPVRAVSRSAKPSDLLLLLLRVSALLLAGIAMAGVSWNSAAVKRGRVVILDRSGAGSSDLLRSHAADVLRLRSGATGTGANAAARDVVATRIVLVDSVARVMTVGEMGSFKPETLSTVASPSNLSSALLAAIRAATLMVRDEGTIDSVELNIVSPFEQGADDAALRSIRSAWPGQIVLTEVPRDSSAADSVVNAPSIRFTGSAANAAVLSAMGNVATPVKNGAANALITTTSASVVSLEWPSSGVPTGWTVTKPDTIGAIVARGVALVWPFVRTATVPDSVAKRARAIAWWSDGAIAAVEIDSGANCTRQVGASLSPSSDALQGQSARALIGALTAPCGSALRSQPLSAEARTMLAGAGGAAAAGAFIAESAQHTPFGSVMLLLALMLLAAEWWVRDRDRLAVRAKESDSSPLRKVA